MVLQIFSERRRQKYRTMSYPEGLPPSLPDRFAGLPAINSAACPTGCTACAEVCPTQAITIKAKPCLDIGRCLFCQKCAAACDRSNILFTSEYRMAVRNREDLVIERETYRLAAQLDNHMKRLFGRSLKLREVSAGGCNACEADTNVLGTLAWDLGRFGIQFAASPRHADGLLVTGPVSENMREALLKTYEAIPGPKLVIAVGACAISGGLYAGHNEVHDGVSGLLPVDLYIPGCPPHPLTILDGLLRLIGRLKEKK